MALSGAYNVWIGNMPKDVPVALVHMMLATCNVVKFDDIVGLNLYSREHDSSAHVSVDDADAFDRLLKLNGTHMFPQSSTGGKPLDVRRARPAKDRQVHKQNHVHLCTMHLCSSIRFA